MNIKFEYRIVKYVYSQKDNQGNEESITEYHLKNVLFKDQAPKQIVDDELFLYADTDSESEAVEIIGSKLDEMSKAFNKPAIDRQELEL